jgi:hypothetical protein
MTLVIGLMADSKPAADPSKDPDTSSILLCADTLASYVAPSPITLPIQVATTSPYQGKLYPLPHGFCAGFCDDYAVSHHVASLLYVGLQKLDPDNPAFREDARKAVQKAFEHLFQTLRPQYLTAHGITEDEFLYDRNLDPKLKQDIIDRLTEEWKYLPAQLIIAGQTKRGPLLLLASTGESPWVRESTYGYAIGSPAESAYAWLRYRQQRNSLSVQRSFYNMIAAKHFCQSDPTVGELTQAVLLQPNEKPVTLSGRGTLLDTWLREFGIPANAKLDTGEYQTSFETTFNVKLKPSLSLTKRSVGGRP